MRLKTYLKESIPSVVGPISRSFFDSEEDRMRVNVVNPTGSQPRSKVTLAFDIPRFMDRMLVDQGISYHFAAAGSLWCLKAAITQVESDPLPGGWRFLLEETHTNSRYSIWSEVTEDIRDRIVQIDSRDDSMRQGKDHRTITYHERVICITFSGENCDDSATGTREPTPTTTNYKLNVARVPSTTTLDPGHVALAQLRPNPYTSNRNRRLRGTINVREETKTKVVWFEYGW